MTVRKNEHKPKLIWDMGTGYDLFVSLEMLHHPAKIGLRRAWAAGVRSRLPSGDRALLEQTADLVMVPAHWVHTLPSPKDGATVLYALGQIPPAQRLEALSLTLHNCGTDWAERLKSVAARGAWKDEDRHALLMIAKECGEKAPSRKEIDNLLHWWSRPEEFGEGYLQALRNYQEVFFAEEEQRIRPALERSLRQARELAEKLEVGDLLEELSRGLQFAELPDEAEWVFAPSYWVTPLIMYTKVAQDRMLYLFGARAADESLVPGERVPDTLVHALKALSDPTRLRILRYLAAERLTPAELARRLRLRPPTVKHHLDMLRLSGLVSIAFRGKHERYYAARLDGVANTFAGLNRLLTKEEVEEIQARDPQQIW